MSGVDVLAVLAGLVADMGEAPGTTGHQVEQARAAVAELIEAAKEVVDSEDEPRFIYGAINSLRAALARVQGGAA